MTMSPLSRHRRTAVAVAGLVLGVSLLAHCSSSSSPTPAATTTTARGPAGGDQASAPWSVPGVTVAPDGVLGTTPPAMTLPAPPAIAPPGPAAPGTAAGDTPPAVLSTVTRVGTARDGDLSDPTVATHAYTIMTADPITFAGPAYLAEHTSSADRDRPLVDTWGMISGSLRAWRSASQTPGALLIGSLILEFESPEAAAGALAHLAARGRGATDHIERFPVDGVPASVGMSYIEYPRSDGAPLPGEMIVFARGRYVAAVMTSGPRPADGRADLIDVARMVDADLSARR
jgi:hypothetical protein